MRFYFDASKPLYYRMCFLFLSHSFWNSFHSYKSQITFKTHVQYPQSYLSVCIFNNDFSAFCGRCSTLHSCISVIVGFDIHKTFDVQYKNVSMPRRADLIDVAQVLRDDNQRQTAQKRGSKRKAKAPLKRCNHRCADRRACGHSCCKVGLSEVNETSSDVPNETNTSDTTSWRNLQTTSTPTVASRPGEYPFWKPVSDAQPTANTTDLSLVRSRAMVCSFRLLLTSIHLIHLRIYLQCLSSVCHRARPRRLPVECTR